MEINSEKVKTFLKINSAWIYARGWITEYLKNFSPEDILKKDPLEISFETGISFEKASSFLKKALSFDADREMEKVIKSRCLLFFFGDKNYPECFSQMPDPPVAFYVKGNLELCDFLAIVGTRKPDEYGIKMTSKIAFDVAKSGMGIASGLARGVDTLAHKAALKANGRTAAIIGSGLNNIYPPENKKLADEICDKGGFVMSEYVMDEPPLKTNFPARNRLISALSWGTLVIEGDYASGALITARHALVQGKEVMAVPGRVDNPLSNGPNKLLKDGASPVSSFNDVLDVMPFYLSGKYFTANKKEEKSLSRELEGDIKKIYNFISANPGINSDELSVASGFPVSQIFNFLFELETAGIISQRAGRYYTAE